MNNLQDKHVEKAGENKCGESLAKRFDAFDQSSLIKIIDEEISLLQWILSTSTHRVTKLFSGSAFNIFSVLYYYSPKIVPLIQEYLHLRHYITPYIKQELGIAQEKKILWRMPGAIIRIICGGNPEGRSFVVDRIGGPNMAKQLYQSISGKELFTNRTLSKQHRVLFAISSIGDALFRAITLSSYPYIRHLQEQETIPFSTYILLAIYGLLKPISSGAYWITHYNDLWDFKKNYGKDTLSK